MHGFRRRHGELTCTFEDTELRILTNLCNTLIGLLTSESMPPVHKHCSGDGVQQDEESIFAELENDFACEPADDFAENSEIDPALRRLFPDAYSVDKQASAEFRRFSQAGQRDEKLDAAVAMLADLNQVIQSGRCQVPDEHIEDWLKTLTALRLAVSVRLGIATAADQDELAELPESDPRMAVFEIYEWLGWVQESLLDCLS